MCKLFHFLDAGQCDMVYTYISVNIPFFPLFLEAGSYYKCVSLTAVLQLCVEMYCCFLHSRGLLNRNPIENLRELKSAVVKST